MENPELAVHMNSCKSLLGCKPAVYTANGLYARSYLEPMFLHREDPYTRVTLENLFVLPKTDKDNILTSLAKFTHSKTSFLILSGDAGTGKTTLISHLNYLSLIENDQAKTLFDGRPIVTIRLRDLNKDSLDKNHDLYYFLIKQFNIYTKMCYNISG